MTFGEKLVKIRNNRGMSQRKLAELLGIAQSTLSKYEAGKRVPSSKKLGAIVRTLDLSADEIKELISVDQVVSEHPVSFGEKKSVATLEEKVSKLTLEEFEYVMEFVDLLISRREK